MTVEEFNIDKGVYIFGFDNVVTEFHSHPAIEMVISKRGDFTLWTGQATHTYLKFAILPANQKHKLRSTNGEFKIIMIEHRNQFVSDHLKLTGIDLSKGCFLQTETEKAEHHVQNLVDEIHKGQFVNDYDSRISETIGYLNQNDLAYEAMIQTLRAITHLSESRLSHLFKANVGVSLKKYLIWTRLKSTIKNHLYKKEDLFTALLNSGFYDQPHFSKSFKSMLGVKPSKAYRSRNVQVLSPTAP